MDPLTSESAREVWAAAAPGPAMTADQIQVSYFRFAGKRAITGQAVTASLQDLLSECWTTAHGTLSDCNCREGDEDHAPGEPCKGSAAVHVYADLTNGRRRRSDVTAMTAVFIDCDEHRDFRPLLAALDVLGIAYLWSESISSAPSSRRWHIVLPLDQRFAFPVDAEHHAAFATWWGDVAYRAVADALFALGDLPRREWDESCSSVPRIRYVGTRANESAAPRQVRARAGRLLHLPALLAALGVPMWAPVLAEDGTPAASRPASGSRAPASPGEPDGGPTKGESTGSLLLKAASAWGTLGPAVGSPPSKYMVLCPWAEEHTTGQQARGIHDSSTVIMVVNGGGFRCAHAHCVDRTAREYLSLAVKNSAVRQAVPDRKRWGGLSSAEQAAEMADMQAQAARKAAAPKNAEPPAAVTVEGSEDTVSAESTDTSKVANAAHEVKMSAAPVDVAALAARMAPRLAVLRAADEGAPVTPIDRSPRYPHLPARIAATLTKKSRSGGALKETTANVISILSHDDRWAGVLAWNAFAVRLEKTTVPPWHAELQGADAGAGEWSKADDRRLVAWLEREYGLSIGSDTAGSCVAIIAKAHAYHPVQDYLSSLKWDGVPRLATWLHTYLGAAQSRYTELVGTMWAVSAVARIYSPGCKVDTMMVLEGDQGKGKGQTLRKLAEPWFSDSEIAWQTKDKYQSIQGVWIYEVAELAGLGKHDDALAKAFLSSQVDRFRAPYDSVPRDWARSVCFGGSVNPDGAKSGTYLKDPTGGRRYWPVRCFITRPDADLAGVVGARDQLWAEAVARYRSGATWWPSREDEPLFIEQQAARSTEQQADPWDQVVAQWMGATIAGEYAELPAGNVGRVPLTPTSILQHAINMLPDRQDQRALLRAGAVLRRLGWAPSTRQQTIARVRCFPYVPSLTGDDATTYAQVVELGDVDVLRALYSGPLTTERLRAALAAAQARRQPIQEELPHVE